MNKKLMRKLFNTIKKYKLDGYLPTTFKEFCRDLEKDNYYYVFKNDKNIRIHVCDDSSFNRHYIDIKLVNSRGNHDLIVPYKEYQTILGFEFRKESFDNEEEYIEKAIQFLDYLEGNKETPKKVKPKKTVIEKTKPSITIHGEKFELNDFLLSQYREEHLQSYIVFNSKKTVTFYQNFSEQSKFLKARADRNIKYVLDKNEASEFKENYFIIDKNHNAQIMDYNKVERYYNENLKKPETTGSN